MNRTVLHRLFCLLTVLALLFLMGTTAFAADETLPAYAELKNPAGNLLVVSKYGNTEQYPEQSTEGIVSAAEQGADLVYVYVRKTADGFIVLSADENLSRMCVDSLGNAVDRKVQDVSYQELSTFHLRQSTGSLHEKITPSEVPTLIEAAKAAAGKALLLVDGGWADRDEIYEVMRTENLLSSVVLVADGKPKEVKKWMDSKPTLPLVVSKYNGNIVFSARSMAKKTMDGGAVGTWLQSSNPYGVVYHQTVLGLFPERGRAMIDMTDPSLCGKREDNAIGWNDVTARGYSVLITNQVEGLVAYRARLATQKQKVEERLAAAQAVDVTLCSTESANALKETIQDVKDVLAQPLSENTLMQADTKLRTAVENLSNQTEGESSGAAVTPGRVVAAVLVIAALIALEIILDTVRRRKFEKRKAILARRRAASRADSEENPPKNS